MTDDQELRERAYEHALGIIRARGTPRLNDMLDCYVSGALSERERWTETCLSWKRDERERWEKENEALLQAGHAREAVIEQYRDDNVKLRERVAVLEKALEKAAEIMETWHLSIEGDNAFRAREIRALKAPGKEGDGE